MSIDPNSVAPKYACPVCGTLPREPFLAEDGKWYHDACIEAILECAGDGDVISPATQQPMGREVIFATAVQGVIEKLLSSEGLDQRFIADETQDETVFFDDAKLLAATGSARHQALLGRWYLFGEKDELECDPEQGYEWSKKASDQGDCNGTALEAICLLHGYGVEKNWEDGFELLIEAATDGSGFAAYKLGSYYLAGVHGFREGEWCVIFLTNKHRFSVCHQHIIRVAFEDRKKAVKWLSKCYDYCKSNSDGVLPYEKENVDRYLISMAEPGDLSPPSGPLASVPEHMSPRGLRDDAFFVPEQINIHNGEGENNDHDSTAASTIGMGSAAGHSAGTNSTSLSSQ